MSNSNAVLYKFRIKSGREADFIKSWTAATRLIRGASNSGGSRLHRDKDGLFWAYASWPSESARSRCFSDPRVADSSCFKSMSECVEERFEEVVLSVVVDELYSQPERAPAICLISDRLLLRPLVFDDAPHVFPALHSEETMRYWSCGPKATVDEVREYLKWNIEGAGVECFAITRHSEPEIALGWVALIDGKQGDAEIGFILRPDARGEGLGKEAASRVLEHAFETRNLSRISADVDPENTPSIRCLEALGMKREGHLRNTWTTHIGVRDSYIYARLSTD